MSTKAQVPAPTMPKILCVDDELHALDSIERALRKDFKVFKALGADEALKILRVNPDCAVILSDHRMPGRSGLSFLAEAKTMAPIAVRAIVSGQIDLPEMANAINANLIHRFILKPWDADYLKLQMLEALANHRILKEKDLLERLSITDPITQLTNHRYFQDRLKIELDRADRHNRPLSLLMLDLDHFKHFNDQFGHPEGDRLLAGVAARIVEEVRNLDSVSRYGGEEFAVVMPDTGPDEAFLVAQRLRQAFEQKAFTGPGGRPNYVTVSIGVASFPHHGVRTDVLISAADRALYQAKRQGRNQTVVAGPVPQ